MYVRELTDSKPEASEHGVSADDVFADLGVYLMQERGGCVTAAPGIPSTPSPSSSE